MIVSNHGGWQVDGAVSLDALVEVRDALPEAIVLMDGGIRTAADIPGEGTGATRCCSTAVRVCAAAASVGSRC